MAADLPADLRDRLEQMGIDADRTSCVLCGSPDGPIMRSGLCILCASERFGYQRGLNAAHRQLVEQAKALSERVDRIERLVALLHERVTPRDGAA